MCAPQATPSARRSPRFAAASSDGRTGSTAVLIVMLAPNGTTSGLGCAGGQGAHSLLGLFRLWGGVSCRCQVRLRPDSDGLIQSPRRRGRATYLELQVQAPLPS